MYELTDVEYVVHVLVLQVGFALGHVEPEFTSQNEFILKEADEDVMLAGDPILAGVGAVMELLVAEQLLTIMLTVTLLLTVF